MRQKRRRGFWVYQNNYRASLMACLGEVSQTLSWIGDQAFRGVAARLIDDRPPDSWSLDHYAAHFPGALAEAMPEDPEVAELAMLEQALADAFVGQDAIALTPDQLAYIDWDTAMLRLVPTVQLLTINTNAAKIWTALCSGIEPPTATVLTTPATLLLWRAGHMSCFRSLDRIEYELISDMFSGLTFTDVCGRLVSALGEAEGLMTAGKWLARWAADGVLIKIVQVH
ncbi:MAG: putative DNA-binding domain-containing protein [Sphingomonadales bacterium]|nr:putative DNA-binding domain-containing protein [Sphingomonadales bacterium]